MNNTDGTLPLAIRWAMDAEMAKKGGTFKIKTPQCNICANKVRGDAMHCLAYANNEEKPKEVLLAVKECTRFVPQKVLSFSELNKDYARIIGSLFGFAVGDAMGLPFRFKSRATLESDKVKEMRAYGTYFQYFGTWAGNTSGLLYLIKEIVNHRSLEIYSDMNVKDKLLAAVNEWGQGKFSQTTKNTDDENSFLLNLVLPLTLYCKSFEDVYLSLNKICIDGKSLCCCVFAAIFMAELMACSKEEAYKSAMLKYAELYLPGDSEVRPALLNINLLSMDREQIPETLGIDGILVAAIWSILTTDNYNDALLQAINLGGDTNTVAAITGGFAGGYYGADSINFNWVQCLLEKENIYNLALDFAKLIS